MLLFLFHYIYIYAQIAYHLQNKWAPSFGLVHRLEVLHRVQWLLCFDILIIDTSGISNLVQLYTYH